MMTTVIICAYTEKRWDNLISAIESLHQHCKQPDEIILVIDHNEILYERSVATFNDILIYQNAQQKGLSGARNTGIAYNVDSTFSHPLNTYCLSSNIAESLDSS